MTNSTLQGLRDSRASIWDQMKKIMDSQGADGLSAEKAAEYDRLESDLDRLGDEITRAEAFAQREAAFSQVDRSGVVAPAADLGDEPAKGYTEAFNRYMRHGITGLDHSDQKILNSGFVRDDAVRNAAGVGAGAAGGYTVPPAFRQKMIETLTTLASMRQLAEVITTETGADLPWVTADDSGEGHILGENTQDVEQDPTFGTNSIGAYTYTSRIVRASLQLLNDNAFNFEGWLTRALAARIARVQQRHFTVGTGVGQPDGLFTSAPVGVTAAAVNAVTVDELIDLTESIDEAYLGAGNVGFDMNRTTRRGIRKLKDTTSGRPLWEPSLTAGVPDTLLGYPVRLNGYIPTPAAGAKTVGFGDVREAYLIRDVSDFALLRLSERYADYLQVGFLGFQRTDATLQNAAAYRTLQQKAA